MEHYPLFPLESPLLSTTLSALLACFVLFTEEEPMSTHNNQPMSVVYLWFHSWCFTFYGFGKICSDMYLK